MNISQQLDLLLNIKNSIKNRLIERGADISINTPFSQYAEYILTLDKSLIIDGVLAHNQPQSIKEQILRTITDCITFEKIETEQE